MFRCLGRLGCGFLLIVLGAAGWHWRDVWMPKVKELVTAQAPAESEGWSRVTVAGAARAKARIESLRRPTGPAYVNIDAADFAAFLLGEALAQVTSVDSAPTAIAREGTLYLRTRVRLLDLGGRESLGPIASAFDDTESLLLSGRLEPVRKGLAQLRLDQIAIRDVKLPAPAVNALSSRWGPKVRPEGVAADALPVILPPHVADLRISGGKVTLYKSAE